MSQVSATTNLRNFSFFYSSSLNATVKVKFVKVVTDIKGVPFLAHCVYFINVIKRTYSLFYNIV